MSAHSIRSFASTERFLRDLSAAAGPLRPAYVLLGDEAFLYGRCRSAAIAALVDPASIDFGLRESDLAEISIFELLDSARTPSLMAPFQLLIVRNMKSLYGRGAKKEELAAIEAYLRAPNPQALLLFVADHIHIPSDLRRMEMQDKERYERIRETLGEWCGIVELPRIEEGDAAHWLIAEAAERGSLLEPDAARSLVEALGADMLSMASELEKLLLYTGERKTITLPDVEAMVLGAKQRSLYELTDAISLKNKDRALARLQGLLHASTGGEESVIGHLFMLAKTYRQMLVILEKNVRDPRAVWSALWPGFRMPPFAADDLIRQARRYKSATELTRALRLIARADLEVRSSPPDKQVVLERLVLQLASGPQARSVTEND